VRRIRIRHGSRRASKYSSAFAFRPIPCCSPFSSQCVENLCTDPRGASRPSVGDNEREGKYRIGIVLRFALIAIDRNGPSASNEFALDARDRAAVRLVLRISDGGVRFCRLYGRSMAATRLIVPSWKLEVAGNIGNSRLIIIRCSAIRRIRARARARERKLHGVH